MPGDVHRSPEQAQADEAILRAFEKGDALQADPEEMADTLEKLRYKIAQQHPDRLVTGVRLAIATELEVAEALMEAGGSSTKVGAVIAKLAAERDCLRARLL